MHIQVMALTRLSTEVFLFGKPAETLSTAKLPSKGDVLRLFHLHHLEENEGVNDSVRITVKAVSDIWQRVRTLTQRIDVSAVRSSFGSCSMNTFY